MAKILGLGGNLTITNVGVIPVSEWSSPFSNEIQDVSDTASDQWREIIAGFNQVDITCTAFFDNNRFNIALIQAGTECVANLAIGQSGRSLSGQFIISSLEIQNAAQTAVVVSLTLASNGVININ